MDQKEIFITIVGMALVTYIPRVLPILFLSGRSLHPLLVSWLRLIPPAILAAMLIPSLVAPGSNLSLSFTNLFLLVALIVLPISLKTKSLCITVFSGMALVALGRYLGL